ncbi:MAG: hypothetical protein KZQ95_13425 [Candidatus Thiodiazotropha sp. (ex Epidulcina cf. delphinae)]|nr:hypothetical protein [Candidatus Thiodiazotropha sp. (ex Epidulcina cf. delphinae)]
MDSQFEQMIQVNIQGRVFVICQSHGITDPTIIGYYIEILEQAIISQLTDGSTPTDFQRILTEQVDWLEAEISQVSVNPQPAAPSQTTDGVESEGDDQKPATKTTNKKVTGYMPEAKSMPELLKDRRAIIEHLLDNDCITLKLVTPTEAKKFKHGLLGREPEEAEEALVAQLRNVLHNQVRKFIRKHNGGPWASATLQHDVRMDITKTRTLRSLVTLSRQLLNEREEWLSKTKNSLTGRFFSGRVKMDK